MAINTSVIEINGVKHILTFGLGFLEQLNNKYQIVTEGFGFSAGVATAMAELKMHNPVMVADFIRFGTMTNHNKPTDKEIEAWVIEQMDGGKAEDKLFDDFFELLKKVPGAKRLLKSTEKAQEELENKEKAEEKKAD